MKDRFYQWDSRVYRLLLEEEEAIWMIDCLFPKSPFQVAHSLLQIMTPWEPIHHEIVSRSDKTKQTKEKRKNMLQPLLNEERCIRDAQLRKELAAHIAEKYHYTPRRILELYYKVLAQGEESLYTKNRIKTENGHEKNIKWAINKYYYSSYQTSLKQTYTLMLMERYAEPDMTPPTYNQFYHYYHRNMRNSVKKEISRNGITHYQQNYRYHANGGSRRYQRCVSFWLGTGTIRYRGWRISL